MTNGISALKSALTEKSWTQDPDIIAPHLVEWRDKYAGHTPIMIMPDSTEEVARAVKICAEHNLKIVPQGGNTGLVGGQTPLGEVLLSTRRLTRIRHSDPVNNSLTVEAGVTLADAQAAAHTINRKFPLSLASESSCTIGGNLSTNAGGVHVLKYGTVKELVFGVETVLANGDIFNGLSTLRKDNTGYDLSHLFLGAEGTLGIITAASLKLFAKPGFIQRVMVGFESPENALRLLEHCSAGNRLSMFEVIPQIGLDLVTKNIHGQRHPFNASYPWYAVIDWEVETQSEGAEVAERLMSSAIDKGLIFDAVIAQSDTQAAALLALREHMSAGQKFAGGSIKFDITVPINHIPDFFKTAAGIVETIVPNARPIGFGHFGDGNIHYNIAQPKTADKATFLAKWQPMSEVIFDLVESYGGSISAEHGIGTMKKNDLHKRADPVKLSLLRAVKTALDPTHMMNPRVLI